MKWRLLASMGWAGRAFWAGMFVLLVALAGRLLWRASQTETGFGSLAIQWRDATAGWIIGPYEPIYTRDPPEQAEYWLAEVDRVLEAHPDDPALAMGAALLLDSPGDGYLPRYVIQRPTRLGAFSDWDREGLQQVADAFEDRCHERCLELAAKATKLDPTNLDWWRLRAMLLRPASSGSSGNKTPRVQDWLRTLDECARHDPDNALYDYLAASFYWDVGGEARTRGTDAGATIEQRSAFTEGTSRFAQGQAKRFLGAGDMSGFKAASHFLSQTRAPLIDCGSLVAGRPIGSRRMAMVEAVQQWQRWGADQQTPAGQTQAAPGLSRRNLPLIDRYRKCGRSEAYNFALPASKLDAFSLMRLLTDAPQGDVAKSQPEEVSALLGSVRVDQEVINRLLWELTGSRPQALVNLAAYGRWASADVLLADAAPSLIVLLGLLGLLAIILSRRFADPGLPVVGPLQHLCALVVATVTTAFYLGLAPAEVISRLVQAWFFTVVLLVLPVILVLWIGWRWLRRRAFQFSLSALLLLTLIASVLFSMVAVLRPQEYHEFYFSHVPFPLSVPRHGWHEISAAAYNGVTARPHDPWLGAACQWVGYHGPSVTVALWAGLVAILYRRKLRKSSRQEGTPLPGRWKRLAGLCRSLGQPALVLAAMLLAVYLFLAPGLVERAEQRFQDAMAVSRQSPTDSSAIEAAAQKVRSDEARMTGLRQSAKTEAASRAAGVAQYGTSNAEERAASNAAPPVTPDAQE